MAFCFADTTSYVQDWRLLYAELFGDCSATSQYLCISAVCRLSPNVGGFFWANNIDSVYCNVPGMVTRYHIIFREIFYFKVVSNDMLFMISWTFILTSVRTATRAEIINCNCKSYLARRVHEIKWHQMIYEAHMVSCPWTKCICTCLKELLEF